MKAANKDERVEIYYHRKVNWVHLISWSVYTMLCGVPAVLMLMRGEYGYLPWSWLLLASLGIFQLRKYISVLSGDPIALVLTKQGLEMNQKFYDWNDVIECSTRRSAPSKYGPGNDCWDITLKSKNGRTRKIHFDIEELSIERGELDRLLKHDFPQRQNARYYYKSKYRF